MDLFAATCNIRFDNPSDPIKWSERKHYLKKLIYELKPDILATQEGYKDQLYDLYSLIKEEYFFADMHRDYVSNRMYPGLFISNKWSLVTSHDRWLSETPLITGSKSFGSRWPKLAVIAEIEKESKRIKAASFHLDNESDKARPKQAKVLIKEFDLISDCENCLLMGDANDSPSSESFTILSKDYLDPWDGLDKPWTYHQFGSFEYAVRIDYIFYKGKNLKLVSSYNDERKDQFYSDHYLIGSKFRLT